MLKYSMCFLSPTSRSYWSPEAANPPKYWVGLRTRFLSNIENYTFRSLGSPEIMGDHLKICVRFFYCPRIIFLGRDFCLSASARLWPDRLHDRCNIGIRSNLLAISGWQLWRQQLACIPTNTFPRFNRWEQFTQRQLSFVLHWFSTTYLFAL